MAKAFAWEWNGTRFTVAWLVTLGADGDLAADNFQANEPRIVARVAETRLAPPSSFLPEAIADLVRVFHVTEARLAEVL